MRLALVCRMMSFWRNARLPLAIRTRSYLPSAGFLVSGGCKQGLAGTLPPRHPRNQRWVSPGYCTIKTSNSRTPAGFACLATLGPESIFVHMHHLNITSGFPPKTTASETCAEQPPGLCPLTSFTGQHTPQQRKAGVRVGVLLFHLGLVHQHSPDGYRIWVPVNLDAAWPYTCKETTCNARLSL